MSNNDKNKQGTSKKEVNNDEPKQKPGEKEKEKEDDEKDPHRGTTETPRQDKDMMPGSQDPDGSYIDDDAPDEESESPEDKNE